MEVPEFSEWIPFKEYKNIYGSALPGVYVLAHFQRKPNTNPNLSSSKVIYVGETTGQTLRKRLCQFSQSAFYRKNGHSGGWTYSSVYLRDKIQESVPDNLYVSVLPVDKAEKESKAYIKLIERLVIWEFFQKNKDYPPCNKD